MKLGKEKFIKEIGVMVNIMEKEKSFILVDHFIKGILRMVNNMEKEK